MRGGIVLTGEVVGVIFRGRVRGEFLQPHFVVVKQAVLGVGDEDGGGGRWRKPDGGVIIT